MEKYLALINQNLVETVVVGDDSFVEHAKEKYEFVIDVTEGARPNAGDSYYPDVNKFIPNHVAKSIIDVDMSKPHLKQGTEEGFEPFNLSKYSVKYANGIITIGCKQYSAPAILDVLHDLIVNKVQTTHLFTALEEGPTHGKFGITWKDAQMLYDALIKVKF